MNHFLQKEWERREPENRMNERKQRWSGTGEPDIRYG